MKPPADATRGATRLALRAAPAAILRVCRLLSRKLRSCQMQKSVPANRSNALNGFVMNAVGVLLPGRSPTRTSREATFLAKAKRLDVAEEAALSALVQCGGDDEAALIALTNLRPARKPRPSVAHLSQAVVLCLLCCGVNSAAQ